MSNTNSKVQSVHGRQFRRVKNGLNEADVITCVSSLMAQNDDLSQRLENVDALMKSSENTIVEAGKQAKAIEMKIEEEAQAEATALIARAEESARAGVAALIAEVRTNASAETARIHEEAEHLRITTRQRVEREVRERFDSICAELFPEADLRTPAAIAVDEHSETSECETAETDSIGPADAIPLEATQELAPAVEGESPEGADPWDTVLEAATLDAVTAPKGNSAGEQQSESAESKLAEPEASLKTSPPNKGPDSNDTLYEGAVEIHIPPPIALDRVLKIHREMKENPRIDVRCFAVSAEDGVKVDLNLSTSVPIVQLLSSMPGVKEVAVVEDRSTKKRRKGSAPAASVFRVTVA